MWSLLRSACCLQHLSAHFENLQFSNDQPIHFDNFFMYYCHTLEHEILKANLNKLALPKMATHIAHEANFANPLQNA